MPKEPKKPRVPSYRHHKHSGRAFIEIRGQRKYLVGPYNSPESREEYGRIVAELLTGSPEAARQLPGKKPEPITVCQLISRYFAWAKERYKKDGEPTSEIHVTRIALQPALTLYGSVPAVEFGPLALIACRQRMIDHGYCRRKINGYVSCIRRAFKFGVSREIVPETTWRALCSVEGLRHGESAAPESVKVKPVDQSQIDAIQPYLSPQIKAMILLQSLTGARPGEVCRIKMADIDMRPAVWEYSPRSHKTQHHGQDRTVFIGPAAQALLLEWVRPELDLPLFSPAEARAWQNEQKRAARKTKVQPSQVDRSKRSPTKRPGTRYTHTSYARAVARACAKAGIPHWSPNRIRHTTGTKVRSIYGLEGSQVILGHSNMKTSEIYSEQNQELARKIAGEIG